MNSQSSKDPDCAILVHIDFTSVVDKEDLEEFLLLVKSAGVESKAVVTGRRDTPDAKYFIGIGKLEEVRSHVTIHKVILVIFNHILTPAQERNLERFLQCRVLDRTTLILDIFGQRARSFEGKLQVELAQLTHLSTRLVRGWTHLERQKGGIGLRGPGETQLETDRRLIRRRIQHIEQRLEKVHSQRLQGRRTRQKSAISTVSLIGYTNAGKSTLFNMLTGAKVYTADQLFATLDPTLRKITLPEIGNIILADTVGFIRHLPHDLIKAFRATLQETQEANLLLHVIDAHSEHSQLYYQQVNTVLSQVQADEVPQLRVYNKIDLMSEAKAHIERDISGKPVAVWISAQQRQGLELLQQALVELLANDMVVQELILTPQQASVRSRLYDIGGVLNEIIDGMGYFRLTIKVRRVVLERLLHKEQL